MEYGHFNVVKYTSASTEEKQEKLTPEAPLQIKINGKAYTITMRTPGNDIELAIGLLFTENIIHSYKDIIHVEESPDINQSNALVININVPDSLLEGKNLFNRSIASSASCGVCGKIDLCDLATVNETIKHTKKLNIKLIKGMFDKMANEQHVFRETGGSHAAAIFTVNGDLLSTYEDIGRHNATDKAIGHLVMCGKLDKAAVLCVSGRVSYEIAAKCTHAKIPILAAVSAPSTMAVNYCKQAGITLIAYCRGERATVYSHNENIRQPDFTGVQFIK